DALDIENLPAVEVDRQEGGVAVAGDEAEAGGGIQREAMVVVAAGQWYPPGDGECAGVDSGQFVAGLDVDEHLSCGGVVVDVSGLAAELDGAADLAGVGVDDGFGAAGLVGGPDGVVVGIVGQPVGVPAGRGLGELFAGVLVDGDHLVGTGGGGVHTVPRGYDEDAVDVGNAADD